MLKFKLRNLSWDNWDKSGTTPVKKFIPRSKYCKLVQFDNWVLIVLDNIFAPSDILSSDFIAQSESKARVPKSCCCERLISLTSLLKLHTIPVKLHKGVSLFHVLKTSIFEFESADLNLRRSWRWSDYEDEWSTRKRRVRRKMVKRI
ncbi:hypothetical protein HanIR_Chr10g0479621 [Helianthus annuus]|nr:hypothetical protein HanIR_Chr10g0479621 [Helianthus annuus]